MSLILIAWRYESTKSATFAKQVSRASIVNQAQQDTAGPGQYDDGVRFNSNTKSFKIGEKRAEKIEYSQGPGAYDHERAERITRTKMATVTMGSSPSRATFVQKDSAIGPGKYDDGKRFNSDTKTFTI